MQEIKKRTIVLASVLKPANEPRMFDKIGTSLAKHYEVYCIGAPIAASENNADNSNPKLIELNQSGRMSLARLFTPFVVLRNVLRIKPSLLIICTHELLFISFMAKILTRCKVIYDVQENYYRNITFGKSFSFFVGLLLAVYVRSKERMSRLFVDHYFLAEKAYENEMSFFGSKKTILENKLVDSETNTSPSTRVKSGQSIRLLFSGTLAETTGVFIAIDLATKLYQLDKNISLKIVGSNVSKRQLDEIGKKIKDHSFIELVGGNTFVPHSKIIDAIRLVDFGIISYPPNPSTFNSIPTKLYEYIGLQLPILLVAHPEWSKICEPFNAAISFKLVSPPIDQVLNAMKTREFYTSPPQDVFWSSEELKLMQTLETIGL
jgi:hypothetical protein